MTVLDIFSVVGVVAFALAGALTGIKKQLDPFGVAMLAITTATGGGVIRDLLIGNIPPTSMLNPFYVLVSAATALAACFLHGRITRYNFAIQICDAVGLGAFTAVSAGIAVANGFNTLFIMIVLCVTASVGGGVLRDLFVLEIPYVFRKEIYALAAVAGAVCFYFAQFVLPMMTVMYLSFAVTTTIRIACIIYQVNLTLPFARADRS